MSRVDEAVGTLWTGDEETCPNTQATPSTSGPRVAMDMISADMDLAMERDKEAANGAAENSKKEEL